MDVPGIYVDTTHEKYPEIAEFINEISEFITRTKSI